MRGMKAIGGWDVICTKKIEIGTGADTSPYPALQFGSDRDIRRPARTVDHVQKCEALRRSEIISVDRIGDCLTPGLIAYAVDAGHRLARELQDGQKGWAVRAGNRKTLI